MSDHATPDATPDAAEMAAQIGSAWVYMDEDGQLWYAQRSEGAVGWDIARDAHRSLVWMQPETGQFILDDRPTDDSPRYEQID